MKFLPSSFLTDQTASSIGGKAAQLLELTRLGMNVPKWGVIPADYTDGTISPSLLREIKFHFGAKAVLAVRSSAPEEDHQTASYAGQFESFLQVRPNGLEEAIKGVWRSRNAARVAAYKEKTNRQTDQGIAVIIQEMIPADVSGVAFSVDPVSGNQEVTVINSVFGLGEGLVSGELPADQYRYEKGAWSANLTEKYLAVIPDQEGIKTVALDPDKQAKNSLTEEELQEIRKELMIITARRGCPQDMEFCLNHGELYILQARPVTTFGSSTPDGELIIWDNSNIVESYPGLTSPLTFSFIVEMYAGVYRQLSGLFGVKDKVLNANAETFRNMLGLIQGRVYYNLKSWYKALSLFPGYAVNARFMETMMGVEEPFDLEEEEVQSKLAGYIGVGRMAIRMISSLIRLPQETVIFQMQLEEILQKYSTLDFQEMSVADILKHYRKFETELLAKWKPPMVNDFFAMIFFGVLKSMSEKLQVEDSPNLHNDLLCGSADIISTEPITRLMKIAELISQEETSKIAFESQSPKSLWQDIQNGRFPAFAPEIDSYLNSFGDRCIGELKLESIPYQDQPEALISMIQSFVKQGIRDHQDGISEQLRAEAEKKLSAALKGKWIKGRLFRWVLKVTRKLVSNRENLRFSRTQAFGMVRKMYRGIGTQLAVQNIIDHKEDVFFLRQQEIHEFAAGTAVDTDLKALIALRQAQYQAWSEQEPAARIKTYGMVNHANDFSASAIQEDLVADLDGTGCCPGKVSGTVTVVKDPSELSDLDGTILVCRSTDPGWVPLFPTAAGLLVERGSLLSHAAIVAREMGTPCIVGIKGLLSQVQTGDTVSFDGSSGKIEIISRVADSNELPSPISSSSYS